MKTPILEFGPDAQLGMTLRDDERGFGWMREHGLEEGKFICVIPRLRYTPYYKVNNVPRVPTDDVRDAINNRTTEKDHAKLRDMIVSYVRKTSNKVMVCAEMTYEIELGKEQVCRSPARGHQEERRVARHILAARRSCIHLFEGAGCRERRMSLAADCAAQRHARNLRAPAYRYM